MSVVIEIERANTVDKDDKNRLLDERYADRPYKNLWVVDDDFRPVRARGYECPPNSPNNVRFFPELGCTFFRWHGSEQAAIDAAKKHISEEIEGLQERIDELKAIRRTL